jgi:hypothetical protein
MRVALAVAFGLLCAACASQRTVGMPLVNASDVRVRVDEPAPGPRAPHLEDEIGGPWQVVADGQDLFAGPSDVLVEDVLVREVPAPRPAPRPVVRAPVPTGPVLAVPRRRAARAARPEGQRQQRTPEQLAREHYLDYPTRLRARKVTFYCPAAYASEVRLTGEALDDLGAGSRRAQGGARLLLRELTLEAARITLKVRQDGVPDLQLVARGDVQIVSDVRGNVIRERGLRSLMITNDRMVPLR